MQCILWYSKCIALHFQLLQLAHLTDRWLDFYETRKNRLIGSTGFQVQSKKKKKIIIIKPNMESTVRKYTAESIVHSI